MTHIDPGEQGPSPRPPPPPDADQIGIELDDEREAARQRQRRRDAEYMAAHPVRELAPFVRWGHRLRISGKREMALRDPEYVPPREWNLSPLDLRLWRPGGHQ